MLPREKKKDKVPKTTAQRLDSVIKSARNKMRKDRELKTDLTRLPTLTWLMFLKFVDDMERVHEDEAVLAGETYRSLIDPPYRWRDWASDSAGITGPDLLSFINGEQTVRADGTKGPGLFTYLRSLRGNGEGRQRRDVVSAVFRDLRNYATSGYVLRDVINLVNDIHFDSTEDIQTLGRMYETLLREMRDAAGQNGEFYTPRPVVRFMVQVIDPKLSETVLDPACGTGGFLAAAFDHMKPSADTVEKREILQRSTLRGGEDSSLPFLLAQMNLLLHGLEAPDIEFGNALRFKLTEIGERDRVEVILTNPPFGGEEEAGILTNFPDDRRTAETALLFLQLIMRRLKRGGHGRAGVVVPNGILFGDGIAARIKADLLEQFNLHTIVRLPEGTFAPYTDIPTNIIFFDTSGPTGDIWYWEQPLPGGRRKYSKTQPLLYEELTDCLEWWSARKEGPQAWKVFGPSLIKRDTEGRTIAVDLDLKNPHAKEANHRRPVEIIESAVAKQRELLAVLDELRALVGAFDKITSNSPRAKLGDIAPLVRRHVQIDPEKTYTEIGVRSFYKGIFHRRTIPGAEFTWQKLFRIATGDLVFSNLMAWEQAIALASTADDGCVGNHRMLTCEADRTRCLPMFLWYYFRTPEGFAQVVAASPGSIARNKTLSAELLPNITVPVPSLDAQEWFEALHAKAHAVELGQAEVDRVLSGLMPSLLHHTFG
ncbi:N-6 DNA methylase [Xanthobacter versatilis]|jgi:type I restriction enzyme M protein|uniref:site-specific DNA-methyltransferase (adenine-specific) n=1 Tax=Xanthobacter autotrophicus (strain ATCC BAA-1158 / Py2) TaxID=78245 RepID=A7IDE4_XANP2|nr:N-6 DNA methylase [Xanthobacter autotrophicus Py2]